MKYIAPKYDLEIYEADEIMLFDFLIKSTQTGGADTPETSDDTFSGSVEIGFDNL